jgi:hypothetical protein
MRASAIASADAGRGAGLVEPAHRRGVGRVARDLGILGGLVEDRRDRVDERVERLAGLRLGRLDEQRLVDDEREVHRRRVHAVVEQALGEVQRADAELLLHRRPGEDELVHAALPEGERQAVADALAQPRKQVVGVEHRHLADVLQPLGAERADVRVRAHEDAVIALETAELPDRFRAIVVEVERRRPAV